MSFLLAVLTKNLARTLADKWSIAIWMGIPLLLGVMMTLVTADQGGAVRAGLIVVDGDGSPTSGALTNMLGGPAFKDLLAVEKLPRQAAMARLDEGTTSAVLLIPAGFGANFLAARPTDLKLLQNPMQLVGPAVAARVISSLNDAGFYLQQGFGDALLAVGGLPATEQAGALNAAIGKLVALVATTGPQIELEVNGGTGGTDPGFAFALFPGLLLMSLIFAAQGLGDELWIEREAGTLRRLMSSPGRGLAFLSGRAVAAALVFMALSLPLAAFGFLAYGLDLARLPLTIMWLGLAGLVLLAIFTTIQMFSPSRRAGALYTIALMFPLLMAGGSFFPLETMPDFLAAMGRLTPNGMMADSLKAYLSGTPAPVAFGAALPLSLGILAVFTSLAVFRFNTGFARS
jgi:ABC-type Na+ efflux pump permease subunit